MCFYLQYRLQRSDINWTSKDTGLSTCTTGLLYCTHRLVDWKMFPCELNATQDEGGPDVMTSCGLTLVWFWAEELSMRLDASFSCMEETKAEMNGPSLDFTKVV